MLRLLFSSAGRRVELINSFKRAASELSINLEVIAIDMDLFWSPACQVAEYAYKVPRCTDLHFFDKVMEICNKHHVNLVIPTIDTELIGYAEKRRQFLEMGTDVLVSSPEFIRVARDKETTAQILNRHGIPILKTWSLDAISTNGTDINFPLVIKPRSGSCSKGVAIISSRKELEAINVDSSIYVAQELCKGREFTINSFYTPASEWVATVPHFRKFVRAGEVCFAETVRVPAFTEFSKKFSEIFPGIRGCICTQGFIDDSGKAKIFEINARFGGGYPICDHAGGTYAKWIIQELSGRTPDYNDNWREGVRMLRYDAAIFTS